MSVGHKATCQNREVTAYWTSEPIVLGSKSGYIQWEE